ncbi:MAG: hypothetical protein ACQET4_09505 [Pseudomonadota bacterium]
MTIGIWLRRNPDISALYERLTGNGKNFAAAMQKLIYIADGALKAQTGYQPKTK